MARSHHYRRRTKPEHELDITTFLNLMVVLVPFLLITAVFSRLTIVELNVPSATGGAAQETDYFRVEVIVRERGFEITNGRSTIASIPRKEDEYDLAKLSEYMVELKREYPNAYEASVLMEPDIAYDYLIKVMDTVRNVQVPAGEEGDYQMIALFDDISVGDAP